MNGVSRSQLYNNKFPVGWGYVFMPDGVDRENYVNTCYRKERVDIILDDGGGMIKNCYISRNVIQDIYFPENSNELGSAVAFIVPKFYDIPIIIGSISKTQESQILVENSFKKVVESDSGLVSIEGRGEDGKLFINVESETEEGGQVEITLRNKSGSSKFNLNCFGDINIYSEGKVALNALNDVEVKSQRDITLISENQDDEEIAKIFIGSDGNVNIVPTEKCNLFTGGHPIPFGDVLQSQLNLLSERLDTLWDTIANSPTASGDGGALIKASVALAKIQYNIFGKENFDNINSEKSFTD